MTFSGSTCIGQQPIDHRFSVLNQGALVSQGALESRKVVRLVLKIASWPVVAIYKLWLRICELFSRFKKQDSAAIKISKEQPTDNTIPITKPKDISASVRKPKKPPVQKHDAAVQSDPVDEEGYASEDSLVYESDYESDVEVSTKPNNAPKFTLNFPPRAPESGGAGSSRAQAYGKVPDVVMVSPRKGESTNSSNPSANVEEYVSSSDDEEGLRPRYNTEDLNSQPLNSEPIVVQEQIPPNDTLAVLHEAVGSGIGALVESGVAQVNTLDHPLGADLSALVAQATKNASTDERCLVIIVPPGGCYPGESTRNKTDQVHAVTVPLSALFPNHTTKNPEVDALLWPGQGLLTSHSENNALAASLEPLVFCVVEAEGVQRLQPIGNTPQFLIEIPLLAADETSEVNTEASQLINAAFQAVNNIYSTLFQFFYRRVSYYNGASFYNPSMSPQQIRDSICNFDTEVTFHREAFVDMVTRYTLHPEEQRGPKAVLLNVGIDYKWVVLYVGGILKLRPDLTWLLGGPMYHLERAGDNLTKLR